MSEMMRRVTRAITDRLNSDPYWMNDTTVLARVAVEAMGGWQPIDTAPKDGSWFLGHFPCQRRMTAIPCRWGADLRAGHEGEHFFGMFGVGELYGDNFILWPTHWMPLPSPPPSEAQPLGTAGEADVALTVQDAKSPSEPDQGEVERLREALRDLYEPTMAVFQSFAEGHAPNELYGPLAKARLILSRSTTLGRTEDE